MSLSGLFLIIFLLLHLAINSFLLFDNSGNLYNDAMHFMGTNPFIKIMEPILAIGFIVHIIYGSILTLKNQSSRPVKYTTRKSQEHSFAANNMWILGALVFVFLIIHIMDFFYKMKIENTEFLREGHNAYLLVTTKFNGGEIMHYVFILFYVLAAILLGFHIRHGMWSAFQTIGMNNEIWKRRLQNLAVFFAYFFAIGYACIPIIIGFVL